ncbi:MAG: hypothetical protein CM1200mP2_00940 [Planctomycetaceae bacterium]|nr:MAG: hypothetical protein CM1200mP2_00940 [Planctomycetaceae bacterium]
MPQLDQGIGALTADLWAPRGMLDDVGLVWMGEFGRTPRINPNVGRDHWAASWSVMVGGGGLKGGQAVGKTDRDGVRVDGKAYLPGESGPPFHTHWEFRPRPSIGRSADAR